MDSQAKQKLFKQFLGYLNYIKLFINSTFLFQVNSIWSEGLCDELECRLTNDLQLEMIRTKITCPACRADEIAVEVKLLQTTFQMIQTRLKSLHIFCTDDSLHLRITGSQEIKF